MEVTSIIGILIILVLGYYLHGRSEDKAKASDQADNRSHFLGLVHELDVDGISDELVQWLETKVRLQTGKDLSALTEELRDVLSEEDGEKQATVQLMLLQQQYLAEKQDAEERRQWHSYVETFRQMNKAQQKHEIERLKKVAEPNSKDDSEKINLLELIHLSGDSKTTDVMIGGVKLFSLKEK